MKKTDNDLFIFIIQTLTYATTQSSVVGTNTLGIGTFDELANYLNMLRRFRSDGKRWTAKRLQEWLARYVKNHPELKEVVDWQHVGAMDNTYLANIPPTQRKQPFEEAAENLWWNHRLGRYGGWQIVESDPY